MGIVVDKYLDRVPTDEYKCFDFVREVWRDAFGVDVGDQLKALAAALTERKLVGSDLRTCEKLKAAVDPCFVVMQRKRTVPHIGIMCEGEVLSLTGNGATYDKLKNVARRYGKVSYYLP